MTTVQRRVVPGTGGSVVSSVNGQTGAVSLTLYDAENARDDIASALVAGTGIAITVDDAANSITIANPAASVRTVAPSGGTISINATTIGNSIDSVLSGDVTLNVPSGGVAGQALQGSALASGAQRVITFHASLGRLTGIASTLVIPSGKVGRYALRRTDVTGAAKWLVESVGVEQ